MTGLLRWLGFVKAPRDSYRVQWKTRAPRPSLYLPKTTLAEDLKALAKR